ncbi:hypothetical protein CIB48_g7996 [Xylaria polymorpha]|nr:hypothetical protein CIB48_g7996 [Xylaria polymorpha]
MSLNLDFDDQQPPIHHGGGIGTQYGDFTPFIIDISDSEDDSYFSPPPTKTTFTSQDTSLLVHREGVQNAVNDSFECNAPFPRHGDVQYLIELLRLSGYVVPGNCDVPPVSIDVMELEEDAYPPIYSPIPVKPASAGQDTPPPVHGRRVQDAMGNGSVLPDIDIETFKKDAYSSESTRTISTNQDITPVAEQVGFDKATVFMTDDDIAMTDVGDVPTIGATNINDILCSVLRE